MLAIAIEVIGDGRPDELSAMYGKEADVFVSEGTLDMPALSALKVGSPPADYPVTTRAAACYDLRLL
jgi:hypothetical protein